MDNRKPVVGLTAKLLGVLLVSALLAVGVFFLCRGAGMAFAEQVFLSEKRVEARIAGDIQAFRDFVEESGIASTDAAAVGQWNKDRPDVRLTITGRHTIVSSDSYGAQLLLSDSGLSLRLDEAVGMEFPVNFSDGTYMVGVYNHSEDRIYTVVDIAAVVMGALAFLISMLLYERHVTRSILRLSRQVRQVSQGDLQRQIVPPTRDEIGGLAEDVETMRLAVIEQLRREEDAWRANTQLITAISHDVRTPLTALMGYLDILEDPQLPADAQQAYLDICRSNARRLKALTDELFRFALVFGQRTPEQNLEIFDANTLIEQILLEEVEALRQQGFTLQWQSLEKLSGDLKVDLGHLRRVFENLFSNLRKYAHPEKPILITEKAENSTITVTVRNYLSKAAGQVESTKIGLKTCEKLLDAMGGCFRQSRGEDTFTAEVVLPLFPPEN